MLQPIRHLHPLLSATDTPRHPTLAGWFLLLLALICAPTVWAQPSHDDPRWVATWTAVPSTLPPAPGAEFETLDNQTVRVIVRTTAGGSALRVRVSNTHGTMPLTLGAASVALRASGADTVPGSEQPLHFGGETAITIPRGAVVFSDPLNFTVPTDGDLAVSLYLPGNSGFLTLHWQALETHYVSTAGNHVSGPLPIARELYQTPLLTAVEVIPEADIGTLVMLGDSITDGTGSLRGANQRWPNYFFRRLLADPTVPDHAVAIAAIHGNRVTTEANADFGENLQARFERDVLALPNVRAIILLEGINDIGMSSLRGTLIAAQEIINGYRQIVARAHARGIKVYASTLLPYEGGVYFTEAGNAVRGQVNDFIRHGGLFDGVFDFAPAVADPANPNRIRPDFTTDNLHPNDAGYAAMAALVPLAWFK